MIRKSFTLLSLTCLVTVSALACDTAEKATVEKPEATAAKPEANKDGATAKPEPTKKAAAAAPAVIDVESLDKALTATSVTVCDANSDETREKYGVIPGALLLAKEFDAKALPSDKASGLVFYCHSERCSAAPKAAERALEAGYTDVKVLKVGIKGWADAGKKTDKKG